VVMIHRQFEAVRRGRLELFEMNLGAFLKNCPPLCFEKNSAEIEKRCKKALETLIGLAKNGPAQIKVVDHDPCVAPPPLTRMEVLERAMEQEKKKLGMTRFAPAQ